MPRAQAADVIRVMRLVPVLLASTLVLAGCGAGAPAGPDSSDELAREYVAAINAHDGGRVCALMTAAAASQLSVPDSNLPCDRTVAGFIGYVEDAGMPEFLRYRLGGVRPGATKGEYSSIRLSLEARRKSTDAEQAFETCSFEDTVWLTRNGGELRIAKPSLALYVAFGATNIREGVLAPPGVEAAAGEDDEQRLLDCEREKGVQPDPEAPLQSAAGLAALLARERSVSDVRCFEADGHDGWDVVCTYFDASLGERMKLAYQVGPGSAISGSGSVPEGMPLPAA
jgi:hypothetical protein